VQIGFKAAASALRSFQLAKSRLLRIRCTMQVCSVVVGSSPDAPAEHREAGLPLEKYLMTAGRGFHIRC
jgi:hypothetical protein